LGIWIPDSSLLASLSEREEVAEMIPTLQEHVKQVVEWMSTVHPKSHKYITKKRMKTVTKRAVQKNIARMQELVTEAK
jgi:hypothetical protein